MRLLRIAAVLLVLVAGCSGDDAEPAGPATTTTVQPQAAPLGPGAPPPVVVEGDGTQLTLQPWTYCFRNGCADGLPPEPPPDIGDPGEVTVRFPLPGWRFTATFAPVGVECGGREVPAELDDGVLRPAGPAGEYDVTLFGQGDGDLFVTFRWTTPADGPLPAPEARLAVLADHDGRVDSYGVELELSQLATTPADAAATITVTDLPTGASHAFDATRTPDDCRPEGNLYWDGPDGDGLAAAALGDGPFRYDVTVTLDGATHTATATWPDDQIPGNEPSVPLRFDPPLPAV